MDKQMRRWIPNNADPRITDPPPTITVLGSTPLQLLGQGRQVSKII